MIELNNIDSFRENNRLEAKLTAHGLPKSIWETYSSFANTLGGLILLGVKETADHSLNVVGVDNAEGYIADFWNTINNRGKASLNILSERHVCVKEIDGKNIIVIEVPRAERRYRPIYINNDLFNGVFRRNGEGDYHCTPEEIKSMLRDQSDITLDTQPVLALPTDTIDLDSLRRYRNRFGSFKPDHVWNNLSDGDFLEKIGAVRIGEDDKPHPTGAGILVFGNDCDITKEFPNYFLDYREKDPDSADIGHRWLDRITSSSGDWSGNLFDFYYRAIERLTSDIKIPFSLDETGLDRVDITDVHTAVREAFANALIHTDYYGRQGVVIEKTKNKITISNPGNIRISVEEAFSGGISDPRNACIAKIFSFINIGERAGSGLYNIKTVWERHNWREPIITQKFDPERTSLCLEFTSADFVNNAKHSANRVASGAVNVDNGVTITNYGVVNKRELAVINLISANPHITKPQMSAAAKIPKSSLDRVLSNLRKRNIITRVGADKNGKWLVNIS
ncbi:MAG: putative DNA binding domain-containing protein [Synergistaceae bacterium]|nr:putative DNA binding domain-containing protein [Synergistaceae bacterium]